MELNEVLEGIQKEAADVRATFSTQTRVAGDTEEHMDASDASIDKLYPANERNVSARLRRRGRDPRYMAQLAEAAEFYADIVSGRRPLWQLREAMTTSDFPNLFGDIIDRQMLGNYRETPVTYPQYIKVGTVPDFRTVKRFVVNGSEAVLADVGQEEEYPRSSIVDDKYSYSVAKKGRAIGFSWEAMINDDLQALQDIPARFGKAARRTEEKFATNLFAIKGASSTFFSNTNKNLGTAGVPTIASLQEAFKLLAKQTDADGEPIAIDGVILVVPPDLEVTANNIVNATQLWLGGDGQAEGGGTAGQRLISANWMQRRVTVVTNYYLPIVDTSKGTTAWYLFSAPGSSRPAAEVGKLRGHEEPELFERMPDARRVAGGGTDDVSFDNDTRDWKVRHVIGGTLMEPKAAVANAGA